MNTLLEPTLLPEATEPDDHSAECALRKFGTNSNSFFSLYPGFRQLRLTFGQKHGLICYEPSRTCWVGICEPLVEREIQVQLLSAFFKEARQQGRGAITMPVYADFAQRCKSVGMQTIQLGSEPLFDLDTYFGNGSAPYESLRSVRAMIGKKAQVKEVSFDQIDDSLLREMEVIRLEWMNSRKLPPLGFLNRVEPWTLSSHKKYFYLTLGQQVLAFVAAIPFDGGTGWYLVDVLRKSDAPAGATELLLGEAMRLLKAQGVKTVSLGVAPLSLLDPSEFRGHPRLYPILNFMCQHGNAFYGFQSLLEFKFKMRPTRNAKVFLVAPEKQSLLPILLGLCSVYFPKGVLRSTLIGVFRQTLRALGSESTYSLFRRDIVLLPFPQNFRELLPRIRVTLSSFVLWLLFFLVNMGSEYHLRSKTAAKFAFSWQSWVDSFPSFHFLALLVTPGFLHWDTPHLATNLCLLLMPVMYAELLLGARIVARCLIAGLLLSNPLTGGLLALVAHGLNFSWAESALASRDVGASLAIFSVLGGLTQILKTPTTWFLVGVSGVAVLALLLHDLFQINHGIAMGVGAAVVAHAFKRNIRPGTR